MRQVDDPIVEVAGKRSDGIIGYRADHDDVIVDGMRSLAAAVGHHEQRPLLVRLSEAFEG